MLSSLQGIPRFFFRPVVLARLFFILLTTLCGMLLASINEEVVSMGTFVVTERMLYSLLAFLAASVITIVEHATDAISSHKILMAAVGAMAGLVFAHLVASTIPRTMVNQANAQLVCNLFFGYFGIVLAIKHAERFHLSRLKFFLSPQYERPKVLDSSVIIDGRVRELIELKVITGTILVPNFVLLEIQAIADSNDPNRRARGRRGLDVLGTLRERCKSLEVIDKDFPDYNEVDQKLAQLCRSMDSDMITNDFNLQKIAELHKITVININEMANALKPTVYIGEGFNLSIVREGKEVGQGVGYLEDGTMVVVDEASHLLGQDVPVIVSSILQTSSGRLVFARPVNGDESNRIRA